MMETEKEKKKNQSRTSNIQIGYIENREEEIIIVMVQDNFPILRDKSSETKEAEHPAQWRKAHNEIS